MRDINTLYVCMYVCMYVRLGKTEGKGGEGALLITGQRGLFP